jgi:tetratricopeptide (TPR) repeat protein
MFDRFPRWVRALGQRPLRLLLILGLLIAVCLGSYVGVRHLRALSRFHSAQEALDTWHFKQAVDDLTFCLEVWPNSSATHLLAAQAARRALLLDEAETHLQECERLGGDGDAVALEWALLRVQRGDLVRLETYLKQCVEQNHEASPLILEAMTLGYYLVYDLPHALGTVELLLKREPNNIRALALEGRVLEEMNHFPRALTNYRRILELDPERDEARLFLAYRLMDTFGAFGEAQQHLERLLAKEPDNPDVITGLARCYRNQGMSDKARQILQNLPAKSQDRPAVWRERGLLALQAQQWAEAEKWLQRVVEQQPRDLEPLNALFRCLTQQHKTQEASLFKSRLDQIDAADKQLKKVMEKVATMQAGADVYYEGGQIALSNGQDREAERWFYGALRCDANHRPSHAALAAIYERMGRKDRAAVHRKLAG